MVHPLIPLSGPDPLMSPFPSNLLGKTPASRLLLFFDISLSGMANLSSVVPSSLGWSPRKRCALQAWYVCWLVLCSSVDLSCVLCGQEEEPHNYIFSCPFFSPIWTSLCAKCNNPTSLIIFVGWLTLPRATLFPILWPNRWNFRLL